MRLLRAADGVDLNDGNGSLHVLLDFDPQEGAPLEAVDNATLISRVRKRTRRNGIRCNLTLQLLPEETTAGRTRSVLHATPLRASRSLALRHIVHTRGLTMAEAVFLCTPASMLAHASQQGYTVVGSLTSDMATLVEGAQTVVVVPPSRETRLGKSMRHGKAVRSSRSAPGAVPADGRDQQAFNRLTVSLEPFSEDRVVVLNAAGELEGCLTRLLAQPLGAQAPPPAPPAATPAE
jgi:hypothetical protein